MVRDPELIEGYADALFAVARAEGVLPRVEDELFDFAKAVEQNTPLREALTDAALAVENKKAVVADLLGGRADPVTITLLGFVIDAGRAREIPKIVETLATLAAGERDHALAEVRTAVALTDAQRDRLARALSRATGRTIDVKVVIDPTVVGGAIARVGDEVFDGSIATRLERARQGLTEDPRSV
jgi:F-type H+-transporting ATPase subunit delta